VTGAGGDGGAISGNSGSTLILTDCWIHDNQTTDDGGAISQLSSDTSLAIAGTTLSGNSAGSDGGAIALYSSNGMSLRNSTLDGNVAEGSGGAMFLFNFFSGTASITNSTVTNNTAKSGSGGGIARIPGNFASLAVTSSVISGNSAPSSPDITFAGSISFNKSAIGNVNGLVFTGSDNLPFGIDPRLGSLADNGGLMPTRLPLEGSPLLDRGSNPSGLTTDQRGTGFDRVLGSAVDIGAVESVDATGTPIALATSVPNVLASGGTTYQFTVTYLDDTAIALNTIGNNDVRVTGPNGFDAPATLISVDKVSDGSPLAAT
jgi:hypothetical protein